MTRRREAVCVGLATLVLVYLFFIRFLPPLRTLHLIGDIEGYHYPLLNYAFKALREGRFPLWDPTIYCGLSFAGNIQAQLFYPLTWVLFAFEWHRKGLSFMAIQIYAVMHLWILAQFAYWWLRGGRGLPAASSLLGAATFALSGYILNDFQHLGVICGLAWLPLALWGVDCRRAWMISLAGALALLAGYPAAWIAVAVCVFFYALLTAWRYAPAAALAMLFSLLLAGVQLLPTAELSTLRPAEPVYGTGPPLEWHLLRFHPGSPQGGQYLYHGAAFLVAIGLALRARKGLLAPLGLAAAGLVFLQDPLHAVSFWASRIPTLADVMQHWNFQAVVSAAAALFVAQAWSPLAQAHPRLVFALIPLFAFEQHWFGTRRANFQEPGNHDRFFMGDARIGGGGMRGVDPADHKLLRARPEYRALSEAGLHGTEFRHYGMSVPNGFDPFMTRRLREEIEQYQPFETNRLFRVPVENEAMLRALAVRYVISTRQSPGYPHLLASPAFRKTMSSESHFQVFEYLRAEPAFRFDGGAAEVLRWTAEVREFRIDASRPGDFVLLEHNLPGWRAAIDGVETSVQPHSKAFQKVTVAAVGPHTVRFEYRPDRVFQGALLTLLSTVVLLVLARRGL